MSDRKISQLIAASSLGGTEQIPLNQDGVTKQATVDNVKDYIIPLAETVIKPKAVKEAQKYLVPTSITAEDGVDVNLGDSAYDDSVIVELSWTGGAGTAVYTLPDATNSNNTNRFIRFISNSGFSSNTHVDLTPASGQTLDGSSNNYRINKAYEGVALWSDGSEWFIIQKKG